MIGVCPVFTAPFRSERILKTGAPPPAPKRGDPPRAEGRPRNGEGPRARGQSPVARGPKGPKGEPYAALRFVVGASASSPLTSPSATPVTGSDAIGPAWPVALFTKRY